MPRAGLRGAISISIRRRDVTRAKSRSGPKAGTATASAGSGGCRFGLRRRIEWLDEEDDAPASMKCGEVRMLHLNTSAQGSRGSRAMVPAGRGARSPKRSASDRPRPLWLYNKPTPGNTWLGTYKGSTSLV